MANKITQKKLKSMNTLERMCLTLGTQGGVLSQYDNEYIISHAGFGSWHKHCPPGKVLFIGLKPSNYYLLINNEFELVKQAEEGFICDSDTYDLRMKNPGLNITGMFLVPRNQCKEFDKELILNDR